jgi:hypothetical protein
MRIGIWNSYEWFCEKRWGEILMDRKEKSNETNFSWDA